MGMTHHVNGGKTEVGAAISRAPDLRVNLQLLGGPVLKFGTWWV